MKEWNLPTPWQAVQLDWAERADVRVLVKRDDLIHPLVSGNKWRKLSGHLRANPSVRHIHTFGGPYSNHLIAVAAFASEHGMGCTGTVRGEQADRLSTVLERCRAMGMDLHFVPRSSYREQKARSGMEGGTLWIPEGGSGREGMQGCAAILREQEVKLSHCMLACGTGTTLAGLVQPAAEQGIRLIGVPVLKPGEFIRREVAVLTGSSVELDLAHHFGGYARTTPALMTFIQNFAQQTSILLDPIYTAKAFYAARTRTLNGSIPPGSTLGLVHTGGLTGWYGKWTELIG